MNFGPFVFIGVFCTMIISWATFVFGPQVQIGSMQPSLTVPNGDTYPVYRTGEQKRGADLYRANNCAACHTQQVRPANLGPDLMRGWGVRNRSSVAEDYLYEYPVMLGSLRVGPDLANAGSRLDERTILLKLYYPRHVQLRAPTSVMPTYPFLFKTQPIQHGSSPDALPLDEADAAHKPKAGFEVVPTDDAKALAAYVTSLRQTVYLFDVPPPQAATPISNQSKSANPPTNTPAAK
jgi:cytochrome c oxidase cbb3-type subunit 2